MGRHRRIPVKRTKKIKNVGLPKQKTKSENLPIKAEHLDHQELPKSFYDFLNLQNLSKNESSNKERKKKNLKKCRSLLLDSKYFIDDVGPHVGMEKRLKPVPHFVKQHRESVRRFMNRMEKTTQMYLQQSKFEEKYKVDVVRNPNNCQLEVSKREMDDVDVELQKMRFPKKVARKQELLERRRKKKREYRQKLKAKKRRPRNDASDDLRPESIMFGELVHEPPKLHFKKAKQQ